MTPDCLNLCCYSMSNYRNYFPVQTLCPCTVLLCPILDSLFCELGNTLLKKRSEWLFERINR